MQGKTILAILSFAAIALSACQNQGTKVNEKKQKKQQNNNTFKKYSNEKDLC